MFVGPKDCLNCNASVYNHFHARRVAGACNEFVSIRQPCQVCGLLSNLHTIWCVNDPYYWENKRDQERGIRIEDYQPDASDN